MNAIKSRINVASVNNRHDPLSHFNHVAYWITVDIKTQTA